jgi:hypothetical protein
LAADSWRLHDLNRALSGRGFSARSAAAALAAGRASCGAWFERADNPLHQAGANTERLANLQQPHAVLVEAQDALLQLGPRMQCVEVGIAINAQDDGLAIDNEMLLPVLQRCLGNPVYLIGTSSRSSARLV